MKKNIHPKYHKIKVVMTEGTEFELDQGQENETLILQRESHYAWTGGAQKFWIKVELVNIIKIQQP